MWYPKLFGDLTNAFSFSNQFSLNLFEISETGSEFVILYNQIRVEKNRFCKQYQKSLILYTCSLIVQSGTSDITYSHALYGILSSINSDITASNMISQNLN